MGYIHPPICIGNLPPCLIPTSQVWLLPKDKGNETYNNLFMISATGFQKQLINTHEFPPPLHPCPRNNNLTDAHSRIHWEECQGILGQILLNNSYGTIIDWRPYGAAVHVCSRIKCSDPQVLGQLLHKHQFPQRMVVASPFNISLF